MHNNEALNPLREDLTKDLQFEGDKYVNMEGENHSTAAEGTLKKDDKHKNTENTFIGNEEKAADNTVGSAKKNEQEAKENATHETTLEEDEALEPDKISG